MNNDTTTRSQLEAYKPTATYVGISWGAMLIGVLAYLIGLWNAQSMLINEKGYYLAVLALGLYAAISLQKTLRDRAEGIPTTNLYYMISWAALGLSIALIVIGLVNADGLILSERGFYMMAFTLSLFAAVTIQKNTRDEEQVRKLITPITGFNENSEIDITKEIRNHSESGKSLFGAVKSRMESGD
ncbi:inner membrane protein YiaA [Psychrobacter sp. PAMC 21119]|uniref:inner membrane protein YiaA n=1 Tax=Psychrobacter sp. PAMC 21119 TaxID=1112209 RepID=UPI000289B00E|nr:inner membrane protein YiaA [Psychrobacter sp. PAMC 21119]